MLNKNKYLTFNMSFKNYSYAFNYLIVFLYSKIIWKTERKYN